MLALLLTLLPARAAAWPDWRLPAPLQPAGSGDLLYPSWFAGDWIVTSLDRSGQEPELRYAVRFLAAGAGGVVGDRAHNAAAVAEALIGPALIGVENDPVNPNRQLARLAGNALLESTVVARRSEAADGLFLADELALQVVHGSAGAPRISQVETLSRYQLEADGSISGEQWQATYPSPAQGLKAAPLRSAHWQLRLRPDAPGSDRAS